MGGWSVGLWSACSAQRMHDRWTYGLTHRMLQRMQRLADADLLAADSMANRATCPAMGGSLCPVCLLVLSMYLSIFASVYVSIWSIYLAYLSSQPIQSNYPSISSQPMQSTYPYLTSQPIHLSFFLSINLSVYLPIYLSVFLSIHPSIHRSICLSVCLSCGCVSFCLCVYLSGPFFLSLKQSNVFRTIMFPFTLTFVWFAPVIYRKTLNALSFKD